MSTPTEPLLEQPIYGHTCKDTGKCHHHCTAERGCFRQQHCSPLSYALALGMDLQWRTPAEQAHEQQKLLENYTPCSPVKPTPPPSL